MRKRLTILIIILMSCFPLHGQSIKALDAQLEEQYRSSNLPGFAIALFHLDSIVFQKGYGYENLEHEIPFTTQQRFNIASISKTFIGISLFALVEEGVLTLDTPINEILPFKVINPNNKYNEITIRHLATHTSSIMDEGIEQNSWYLDAPFHLSKKEVGKIPYKTFSSWTTNSEMSMREFLEASLTVNGKFFTKKRFSKDQPGTSYNYSNLGAALAAYIIELKTGTPYDQYIEEFLHRAFGFPAGVWKHKTKQLPTSYFQNKQEIPAYRPILYPTGGIMLSCEELSTYFSTVIQGYMGKPNTLLTAKSFQEMVNPAKGEGIFWELKDSSFGHNGGNYGVISLMRFDKETKKGKLFITNISSYASEELLQQVVAIWRSF